MGEENLDHRESLGYRVRFLRSEQNLTLEEVAERGELFWTQVQRIEQGKVNPTLDTLARLARGLGVPIAHLFLQPNVPGSSDVDKLIHLLRGRSPDEVRFVFELAKCSLQNLPQGTK